MFNYRVEQVMALYPHLQKVAALHKDEGDDFEKRPAYKISPIDIYKLYNTPEGQKVLRGLENAKKEVEKEIGRDKPGCRLNLGLFRKIELYRQLVYYDRFDGNLDGKIINNNSYWRRIYIPCYAKGRHYWGKEWTPMQRLLSFLIVNRDAMKEVVKDLLEKGDLKCTRARDVTVGTSRAFQNSNSNVEEKFLNDYEKKYVDKFSEELKKSGYAEYGELLSDNKNRIKRLEVHVPAEKITPVENDPAEFGKTYLFPVWVYLVTYPQRKQENFYDPRDVWFFENKKNETVSLERPLDGINPRWKAREEYLRPYIEGKKIPEDHQKRIRDYYLRKMRVYNYHRYKIEEILGDDRTKRGKKNLKKFFFRAILLHEMLHYRNSKVPPELLEQFRNDTVENILLKLLLSGMNFLEPYKAYHIKGSFLTVLQRIALDRYRQVEDDYQEREAELLSDGKDPKEDGECIRLNRRYNFLYQLALLAADSHERLVEDEVYHVMFKGRKLEEYNWAEEIDEVLNRTEIFSDKNEMSFIKHDAKEEHERGVNCDCD